MVFDRARSLKHELRTPVNHILGYLALLQETAKDTDNPLYSKQIQQAQATANEINRAMQRALLLTSSDFSEEDFEAMRAAVSAPIDTLISDLKVIAKSGVDISTLEDVSRICSAAERLQNLLQRGATVS